VADPGVRTLQVIDTPAEGAGPCLLRLVRDSAGARGRRAITLIIGSSRDAARARGVGLERVELLPLNGRRSRISARTLRRWIDRRERAAGPFDMIRIWTDMAGAAAFRSVLARPTFLIALSPVLPCTQTGHGVGDWPGQWPGVAAWRDGSVGGPQDVAPAVDQADLPDPLDAQRHTLRERWGAGPDTYVVGLLAEPMDLADAWTAMEAVLRYASAGRTMRLVLSCQSSRRGDVERALRRLSRDDLLVFDEAACRPWDSACGFDAALCLGGGDAASPLPALWAMAAGTPVIADDRPALRSVMSRLCPACLVPCDDHGAVCRIMTRWADDPAERSALGMRLRAEVARSYAMGPLIEALNAGESGEIAGRA